MCEFHGIVLSVVLCLDLTYSEIKRNIFPLTAFLFSFASLSLIENISIISREPPAMVEFIYKTH